MSSKTEIGKELNLIDKNNLISPFKNYFYPKEQFYILKKDSFDSFDYSVEIKDFKLQLIEKIGFKYDLREIKGKGKVSYKPYYGFHMIKNFKIFFKNHLHSEKEQLLMEMSGEDLLMNAISSPINNTYFKYNGGESDEFCHVHEGKYSDDIIFQKREMHIPINFNQPYLKIFANTIIKFQIELYDIDEVISYNPVFNNKSLSQLKEEYRKNDLHLELYISNSIMYLNEEDLFIPNIERFYEIPFHFINKKMTTGQFHSKSLISQNFTNTLCLGFRVRTNHLMTKDKYIINFDLRPESELIETWIERILQDLIIVSPEDFTKDEIKIKYGFDEMAEFEQVYNNEIIYDKQTKCQIFIESVPSDYNVYYHTNILTFTRRYQDKHTLNISKLFSYIKGFYSFNENKIDFNIKTIKHKIDIGIVSIPISIWDHKNNTACGDLRSKSSKNNDFIFGNKFISGTDFLSQDRGYSNVVVIAGEETLNYPISDISHEYSYLNVTEIHNNSRSGISYFNTCSQTKKFLYSNNQYNFKNIIFKIEYPIIPDYSPFSLYERIPSCYLFECTKIVYDIEKQTMKVQPVEEENIY